MKKQCASFGGIVGRFDAALDRSRSFLLSVFGCFGLAAAFALSAMAQNGKILSRAVYPSGNPNVRAEELSYSSDGLRIVAYLLTPVKEGKYPCVIFNHGGNPSFNSLNRDSFVRGRNALLASSGYVVIASQFREHAGSEGHDEFGGHDVDDVLNLLPLLEQVPSCDASRIGMYGVSRGGLMTYRALTQTDRIRAAVVMAGLADLPLNLKSRGADMLDVYKQFIPNFEANQAKALADRSAVQWADKLNVTTPILIFQGTADWRVLPEEGLEMAHALITAKHPVRFVMFEGGSHGLPEFKDEVDRQVLNWFNDYLRDGKKWPSLEPHGQ
jgi:dipeptidyl aminopeptidase/acylaminoacyl peptidase